LPKVVHFEIGADDPKRATEFYEKVFGWKIDKQSQMDYWLVRAGEDNEMGINGAIMPRLESGESVVNTIGVSSLDEYVENVKAAGGSQVTPKTVIPGYGWFSYLKDTEGNLFGIIEPNMNAK
jgi:predicted enzyme related to lactoylglutathione lyase